jgi:dipeptidyl aminopeptidase/acylaminoacyl peptidase
VTRRFTPEVALAFRIVSEPAISPDGAVVAFVLADATRPSQPPRPVFPASAIWSVPAAGGAPEPLTHGRSDTSPRWSPDGRWLAYLSDAEHDGQRQVWLQPRETGAGAPRQLTHLESEIPVERGRDPLAWFPDGSALAFIAAEPTPESTREREARGEDHILFEQEPVYQRLWSVNVASGEVVAISPPGLQIWEFALSPDGRSVAAVVSDLPYEWDWYRARVAVFEVGGTAHRTLHASWRQVAKQAWSPDGHLVAFLTSNLSDRGLDNGQPMVVPVAGGGARAVGGDERVSDAGLLFDPDGRLVTAANVRGGAGISSIDVETGGRSWLWSARGMIGTVSVARLPDGRDRYAAVLDDLDHPQDVHVGEVTDGAIMWRCLTDLHADLADAVCCETREVTWSAADGTELQGVLHLPAGHAGGPLPLVTHVHGGPTNAVRCEFFYHQRWPRVLADAGFAVFLPNFRGSTGFGLEFAEANVGDKGGADLGDVLSGIDRLVEDGIADPDRLGICGWSYGGFTTAWAITQDQRFKAAVVGAGWVDWRSFHGRTNIPLWDRGHYQTDVFEPGSRQMQFQPIDHIRSVGTPTLIIHGTADLGAPVEQSYLLFRALKDLGVETELALYPREPHAPLEYAHRLDILGRIRDWFVGHLTP